MPRKAPLLLLLALVSTFAPSQNAPAQWTRKADMPTPRAGCRAVALEGKLYVIGGSVGHDDSISAFEVYDPKADRWSRLPDLPRPVSFGGAVAHQGKIYVLGEDHLYVFDPVTSAWTEAAIAPRTHRNFDMTQCGGKFYAVGGLEPAPQAKWGSQNLATLDVYDPATGKWESRASMQIARHALPISCAGGKLYVLGGSFTFPDWVDRPIQVVEEYDPATNTWRSVGNLNMNSAYVPALEVEGRIMVFSMGDTPYTQEFDPASGRVRLNWSVPSGKRWAQCAAIIDGTIYQAGGWTEPGKPVSTLETFSLPEKGATKSTP